MDKKTKNIITVIIVVFVVIIGVFLSIFFGSRSERVTANPAGTIGNTAGNLNNGGWYCEGNGVVYFANSYDGGALYMMNVDETNIKKISSARACNILVGGDYMYYFQLGTTSATGLGGMRTPHSYIRTKLDGSKATSITRNVVTDAQLVDNTLFLLITTDDGPSLISINTDKTDEKTIANYIINPASARDGYIYYNNTVGDHYINRLDTRSGQNVTILEANAWSPIASGNYIYYLDLDNNYQLRRYNTFENNIEILSDQKIQSYNMGNGIIYYQTMGDTPGLYCMNADGSNAFLLENGQFTDICMTSRYVYFKNFFDEKNTYHSYIGSNYYSVFSEANNAALLNTKDKD